MRKFFIAFAVSTGVLLLVVGSNAMRVAADDNRGNRIAVTDDCDPNDPGWAPTGGCTKEGGLVNVAEFNRFVVIPGINATVGHPAWRLDPGYLVLEEGQALRVANTGGRNHTFTEVPEYGGGRIPPLNFGMMALPQCAANQAPVFPPNARMRISNLSVGDHKFQCCIHPWMRALVKVLPEGNTHHHHD